MIFSFYDSLASFSDDQTDFIFPYSFNKEKFKEFEINPNLFYDYFQSSRPLDSSTIYDFFYSVFKNTRINSFSQFNQELDQNNISSSDISKNSFVSNALVTPIKANSSSSNYLFTIPSCFSRSFNWKVSLKDPVKFYNDLFVFDVENHKKNLERGYVCFDVSNTNSSFTNTDEDIEIKFFYYSKRNKIDSSTDGHIYSLISKTSYENYIKSFVFPLNISLEEKNLSTVSNLASVRSYYNVSNRPPQPILVNFDFIFNQDLLSQKLEENGTPRIDTIKVPSFSSLSKDTKIEKVSYTKNQVLSRNTSFLPILVQHKIIDESLNQQNAKLLSFISSYSFLNLSSKKRSASRFLEFFKDLTQNDSLKIFNPDLYLEKMKQKFSSFLKYSSEVLQRLSEDQKNQLLNLPFNNTYEPFSSNLNTLILSTPKIDQKLKTKYTKLKHKTDSNLSLLKTNNNVYNDVFSLISQIDDLEKKINSLNENLLKKKQDLNIHSQKLSNSLNSLFATYPLYTKIQEKYNEAYMTSQDFSVDEFLNNYASQGITILELVFSESSDSTEQISLNNSSTKETLSKFLAAKRNSTLNIASLEFCTSSPTKINIVGKSNQSVYGGPYVVKVSQNRIQISLKDKTSLFGYNGTSSFFVHPHSGSSLSFSNLYYPTFSTACLGEASPLLFKAFQDNNIKTILISAMTWVSSANSADTWGKNYIYFPKNLDILEAEENSLSQQDDISEKEVNNFLSAFSEEEEEEVLNDTINPEQLIEEVLNDTEIPSEPQQQSLNQQQNETVYVRYTGNA